MVRNGIAAAIGIDGSVIAYCFAKSGSIAVESYDVISQCVLENWAIMKLDLFRTYAGREG